jgi:hypothetical protein
MKEKEAYYVRFHQAVPNFRDKEPVNEFKLKATGTFDQKYVVESITWTPDGVIYKNKDCTAIVPLANVIYCRLNP